MLSCALAACTKPARSDFERHIAQVERETGSRIGVVAIDFSTSRRIEHRSNERFLMCSTFKLLAAAAVLQRVDRGEEKLDRFVPYSQADILAYAPVTKQHVAEGGMQLGALCEAAIEQSDNTAGNLLLRTIGGPAGLTRFARSLGDDVTRLDRMEPELNEWKTGDERDTTSPEAMCEDLRRLLAADVLSKESRNRLDVWLQHNETGLGLIRAGVPSGWRVGDKTGRSGDGATNDVAVIYLPGRNPIYVAIYTFGGTDEQRSAAIASVTRGICENFRSTH